MTEIENHLHNVSSAPETQAISHPRLQSALLAYKEALLGYKEALQKFEEALNGD